MAKKNKRHRQPGVAIYTDDIDNYKYKDEYEDEFNDFEEIRQRRSNREQRRKPSKKQRRRMQREEKYLEKQQRKKRKKRMNPLKKILVILLLLNIPMIYGVVSSFQINSLSTKSNVSGAKGFLLLGLDDWIDRNSEDGGHTDSITYLAANFKKKEAVSLPIYRDAHITDTCTGVENNINRIYTATGINCLTDSTSALLGLPIDYYVIITMEGLIEIVNHLGGVYLTPTSSFYSDYGEDGVQYEFMYGEGRKMKGPEALAYVRYRGSGNGEQRANRQMELIMAIKDTCMSNIGMCYVRVTPFLKNKMQTNLPVTQIFNLLKIFSNDFTMEKMDVLSGINTEIETGWVQLVNQYDLEEKTRIIREKIFS